MRKGKGRSDHIPTQHNDSTNISLCDDPVEAVYRADDLKY